MISAYFSISQIENMKLGFFSSVFNQHFTNQLRSWLWAQLVHPPVTLPSSHLLNGHLYQLLPVAVGMVWKSQAIRPQLHVEI